MNISLRILLSGPNSSYWKDILDMNIDKAVLAFAGCVVLVSVALAYYMSPYWLLLTAFAGLNMVQAAFTGFCPAAMVFKALGFRQGEAFR
jgi:hypothetical protein